MDNKEDIYVPLDQAREELKKRWNNAELREKIEKELGDKFLPPFREKPRAVLNRQIASPDNGLAFFYHCAKYVGAEPLAWEDDEDMFVSFNEEKKGLGRLRVVLEDGSKGTVDIMNFHENEKKKLKDCVLKNGEKLVDFHHKLFDSCSYKIELYNDPVWLEDVTDVSHYYDLTFFHFIAHGILFETFSLDEREKGEADFVNKIIISSMKKAEEKFSMKPLVVRLYPEDQTDEEDFYWWSYPPSINDQIVNYLKDNNLPIKTI